MGYTVTEKLVMIRLATQGAATAGILSEELTRSSSYLSTLLGDLEEDNLLTSKKGVYYPTEECISLSRVWLRQLNIAEDVVAEIESDILESSEGRESREWSEEG